MGFREKYNQALQYHSAELCWYYCTWTRYYSYTLTDNRIRKAYKHTHVSVNKPI